MKGQAGDGLRWLKELRRIGRELGQLNLGTYAAAGAYFLVLVSGLRLAASSWEGMTGRVSVLGVAAVWSASRGLYGLVRGLEAVYGAPVCRRWLVRRLLCMGYMLAALAVGPAVAALTRSLLPGGIPAALAARTALLWMLYMTVSGWNGGAAGALGGAAAGAAGCSAVSRVFGSADRAGGAFGMAGMLLAADLWAWGVLLGAVLHKKLAKNKE